MDAAIEEALCGAGLSPQEAKAYLACLALGAAKASAIARRAGMLRTTAYAVLGSLQQKGAVSSALRGGVRFFEAADPRTLAAAMEERRARLVRALPALQRGRAAAREKPAVELYEGKAGLKAILVDIIEARPKELLTLSSARVFDALEFYFPNWIKRRVDAGIRARVLQERVRAVERMRHRDAAQLREIRFLPTGFRISTHMQVYGSKVAILALRKEEPVGVLVEDRDIAETQRSLFEALWAQAK